MTNALPVLGHDHADEVMGLLPGPAVIDQHLIDIVAQVVAYRPDDDIAFLVQQYRSLVLVGGCGYRTPQLQQVVQVPL